MIVLSGAVGRRWVKRGIVALVLLVLLGMGSLEALRLVAHRRGVSAVDIPVDSEIRRRAGGANYTDAYRAPVDTRPSLDSSAPVFSAGRELTRTDREIVWEGRAPGLRFLASYHVGDESSRHVTLSTAVFYESWVGAVYFLPVRFVHRRGVPFVLSQTVRGSE